MNKLALTLCAFCIGNLPLHAENAAKAAPATSAKPDETAKHPFLDEGLLPQWSKLTPEQAQIDIPIALKLSRQRLEALCSVTEPTYENTFGALEKVSEPLDRAWDRLQTLDSVRDNPKQREVITQLMPDIIRFGNSIAYNEKLWSVLKKAEQCEWMKNLSPTQKRFVTETMDSFRDNGADLPPDKKARLASINEELSTLSKQFSENVLDSTNAWELVIKDKKELAGMPESWMETAQAAAAAKEHGDAKNPQWLVTLQYPSYGPIMKYADNAALREKVWRADNTVGQAPYDNAPIVAKILALRDEKARLLGFKNYADLTTVRRMAGSGAKALSFIENMHDKVKPKFLEEQKTLRQFKAKQTGKPVAKLDPWDRSYYAEKLRKEQYDFDGEALRPYYSAENVFKGMFDIYSKLYNISITERPTSYIEPGSGKTAPQGTVEVWNDDVRFFDIKDNSTGELLGSFYMDWYPRATKRGGAWMSPFSHGLPAMNGQPRIPHIGSINGNITPPAGDQPALLNHLDVETVFHEFGHLLHLMLSDVDVKALAGTSVAWDFVELPSQINENWTWEREPIDIFARHYKTGEKLPEDLYKKMIAARNFMSASMAMAQCGVAKFDLELHMNYDKYKGRGIDEIDSEVLADYRPDYSEQGPSLMRSLTHVFSGGYSAGYYSYKWAEALEADAFSRFLKEGVLNPKVGADFRRTILSKGDSKPAAELYRDFMGRDPNPDALLIKTGILPAPDENKK